MARLKKDDQVKIISGREKHKAGKIVKVHKNKVLVAGLNMVKKSVKRKSQQEKGGIISVESPLHISNVMLLSKGRSSRIEYRMEKDKKVRYAKKTGEVL